LEFTQEELSRIIKDKSGIDFGLIKDLIPILRGYSGRIIKLKIVGQKRELIIGKELEIRKTLSHSHLYSSAFYVEKKNIVNGIPQNFILYGAGWGHGVGLCQIGAAVMGEKGYGFDEILIHYFNGAKIQKIYS
jgi:SpoIID/LytB domain protein